MLTKLSIFYLQTIILSSSCIDYFYPKHAVTFSHPHNSENSYFGYALQLQKSKDGFERLIVGSPKSEDTAHPSLVEPGAIFTCDFESEKCEQFHFNIDDEFFIKGKNYSSFGFTLDVDHNGRFLGCAPRWINYKNNGYSIPRENGMCIYMKNIYNSTPNKLMPLLNNDFQFDSYEYEYILGQAGFSSHLLQDKDESVIFTALGVHNWTGSIIQYTKIGQKLEKHLVVRPKHQKLETYSYFGYSLSSGRFNTSARNKIFYVSGAPRSDNLTGGVFVFEKLVDAQTYVSRYHFPGRQFGENFGASLAVADIDGDGMDDLIIGAPMFSSDVKFEEGCVYLYTTQTYTTSIKFKRSGEINDGVEGSRFGTAIASLGDINKDGLDDIAVGAPYYKGTGAVFIYLGQKLTSEKVLKKVQTIFPQDFNPNLRGFGYSLSRGVDIDKNLYNDLAVGSFLSGHVVVFKTKPIVEISTTFTGSIKQINVNTKDLYLTSCIIYTGKDCPSTINITTVVSADKNEIVFNNNYIKDNLYTIDKNYCENISVSIQQGLMQDVKFTMNYKIKDEETETQFCKFCPKEEKHTAGREIMIPFVTGCKDSVCKPNLKLSAYFNTAEEYFIIGSANEIRITVQIENLGENSFNTEISGQFSPAHISGKFENACPQFDAAKNISCQLNGLLAENQQKDLVLILNLENLRLEDTLLNISLTVFSSTNDIDINDNVVQIKLSLRTDVKYNIDSTSEPEQLLLTENSTSSEKFLHTYTIESIGKTELEFMNIYIYIPYIYNNFTIVENAEFSGCQTEETEEIIENIETITDDNPTTKILNLNCTQTKNLKCKKIKCEIKDDNTLKSAKVEVKLFVNMLKLLEEAETIFLVTSVEPDSKYYNTKSYSKTTLIALPKAASLTLYIVIGVVVGFVLILIIFLILYYVGFFKRNRPKIPEDKQLLDKKDETEDVTKVELKEDDITKDESDE